MASRTWLAVSLMLLIWFGYVRWFAPLPPAPTNTVTNPQEIKTNEGVPSSEKNGEVALNPKSPTLVQNALFGSIPKSEKGINLTNGDLDLVFSTAGGKIAEAKLPQFTEEIKGNSPKIEVISSKQSTLSLATLFTDNELREFSNGEYVSNQAGNSVSFVRADKAIQVTKEFKLSDKGNYVDATLKMVFPAGSRKDWGSLLIPVGTNSKESFNAELPLKSWEVVAYQNDAITRKILEAVQKEEEATATGNSSWLAFGNRYFTSAVIHLAETTINPDVVYKKSDDFLGAYFRYPIVLKDGQNEIVYSFKYYLGPKDFSELSKVPGLKKLIDYGFFTFFAYPLLELLQFFNKFVHNFGISIILLTLLVRAVFYPLSMKSMNSMKAMQKLQPQIAAIKEKYKDDQKKLNEEQMALFKTHKVNPAGGCLPMLVQLPVFIALYAVLGNSIELFHAPFFGWIHDLSTKDPFYIYPVLMGVAMFVQQKMTPSVGMDPAQQKIMLVMPVIFSFMMINLPSGLTIYIFVSTILGIVQQMALRDKTKTVPATA